MTSPFMQLTCRSCGHQSLCGRGEMIARLRQIGMLKRSGEPDPELLVELFTTSAKAFTCTSCDANGLVATAAEDELEGDWGEARRCASCRQPIPPERLEVFPTATFCAACQSKAASSPASDEPEFCPRCGSLMTLRQTRGAGITRYAMRCPQCRR